MLEIKEFNLIDENWIPCILSYTSENSYSTAPENLSIKDVLMRAHKIAEIIGENPLITVSLYRLLIAVLHDMFEGPKDPNEWGCIWNKECFNEMKVEEYCEKNHENFFLFHDEKPFYQSANIVFDSEKAFYRMEGGEELKPIGKTDPKKSLKPISVFFLQGEDFATLFEHANVHKPTVLSFGEAARYLLAYQNFDFGGTHTYFDTKYKSCNAGLLRTAAVAVVKGKNLFETLMLNATQYNREFGIPFPGEKITYDPPAWKNTERIDPKKDKVSPCGYLDLLTWQAREVRLHHKSALTSKNDLLTWREREVRLKDDRKTKLVKYVVAMKGNQLKGNISELQGKEQMFAFKNRKAGWIPISFQKERAVWRDSYSLFHSIDNEQSRLKILDWLYDLIEDGKLEPNSIFPLDFFGLRTDQAKTLFYRHERLPMPVAYLRDNDLCDELKEALKFSEDVALLLKKSICRASTLYYLPESRFEIEDWYRPFCSKAEKEFDKYKKGKEVKDKFKPVGEIPKLVKTLAPEFRYWSRLETPFREHLRILAKDKTKWKESRKQWANKLYETSYKAFLEATQNLGNSPNALRSISISQNWFKAERNARRKKFLK